MRPAISLNLDQVLPQLPQVMEAAGVPGLVLSLIDENQVSATHAFGVKSTTTQEPTVADTVFQAASLSKPVFAYAVLGLIQNGTIDLDQPLSTYLSLAETQTEPQLQNITARHVLSHSSGLQNWRFEPSDQLQSAFPPGERFAYSGEGYFYLQRVVEQITSQGIETFLQAQVLRPLGMHHSSYIWRTEHEQQLAAGHQDLNQPVEPWNAWMGRRLLEIAAQQAKPLADWRYEDVVQVLPEIHPDLTPLPNNVIPNVAGSLITTAPEFAQFMVSVMNEADNRLMLTPQVRLNEQLAWGLGWGLEEHAGKTYFWHWGENGLFENFALGNPSQRNGIVILTNGHGGLKVCEHIVQQIMGHDYAAFRWI